MEFSTFGSCSSRNIFNSQINEDYKKFFHINDYVESVTLISLMSKPIEFNSNLINSSNSYDNLCVKRDFSKEYLNFLKKNLIDYLIIDTYFDIAYGILILDDSHIISDSIRLKHTDLYNTINYKTKLNINENFEEYLNLYHSACNSFFKFMETHCNNTKIILNCSRNAFKYYENGQIIIDENLKRRESANKYRDILDSFILKNFDVEVLPFDKNTLIDKNHIFGLHPIHYEKKYYLEKNKQLNDIIRRNLEMEYENKFNKELRCCKRKEVLNKFIK